MACSPARLFANRRNSLKSTGPKTLGGKLNARRNALKHGMTGTGVVVPMEDLAAIDALEAELHPEIAPKCGGAMARILIRRVAVASVRMDRCVRNEVAAINVRIRAVTEEFDESRLTRADQLLDGIAADPATKHRRLLATPEGVQVLIGELGGLGLALINRQWSLKLAGRLDQCMGRSAEVEPPSRCFALSLAVLGRFDALGPDDAPDLSVAERAHWARTQLVDQIDAEIASLHDHLDAFDPAELAQRRAEACDLALFDPGKEANLARKYEATAERAMHQSLRELKEMRQTETTALVDLVATVDDTAGSSDEADDQASPSPATAEEMGQLAPSGGRPRPRRRKIPTARRLASFFPAASGPRIEVAATQKANSAGAEVAEEIAANRPERD